MNPDVVQEMVAAAVEELGGLKGLEAAMRDDNPERIVKAMAASWRLICARHGIDPDDLPKTEPESLKLFRAPRQ